MLLFLGKSAAFLLYFIRRSVLLVLIRWVPLRNIQSFSHLLWYALLVKEFILNHFNHFFLPHLSNPRSTDGRGYWPAADQTFSSQIFSSANVCRSSLLDSQTKLEHISIHDSHKYPCHHVSSCLNSRSQECEWMDRSLTKVAGLAGQGVELLLIGPLLIAGGWDDEQAPSPAKPAIRENGKKLMGSLVYQWKFCFKTGSLCSYANMFPCYSCQRVTTTLNYR